MPFLTGLRVSVPQRKKLRRSDLTRGLVFCAVPHGNTFIDLVTGVIGTVNGVTASAVRSQNGGMSRADSTGVAVNGDGASTTYVEWPASYALRGGNIINTGTVLCLGGTTEQVDGKFYEFGGSFETYNGHGLGLGIDSNLYYSRGPIMRVTYSGNRLGDSYPNMPLGTTNFGNKTHLFGYAFNSNGVAGNFFGARQAFAWSGGAAHGTTTTGRKATVLQPSVYGVHSSATYVLLFLMWNRELSVAEYQRLYDNIDLLFEPEPLRWFISGSVPQLLAPTGQTAGSTWIASNGGALYTCVDETVADEADYTYTTTPGAWEEFTFPNGGAVSAAGGFVRYNIPAGSGAITVELRQGASVLETWGPHALTGSLQTFSQSITASTSDSNDLRVRFTAS